MVKRLSGCVCVVTGASRGIGRSISLALGKEGAIVYITARTVNATDNDNSLQHTADLIDSNGGKAISIALDHSDDTQVFGLFNRIRREQSGRLDLLVNCAFGASHYLLEQCKLDSVYWESMESPSGEWDLINRVGLRNAYICSVLATKLMIKCRESKLYPFETGLIINISSISGQMRVFNVAFCSGKSGLDRMSQEMARDLNARKAQISVLSLIPGLVQTNSTQHSSGSWIRLFGQDVNLSMAMPISAIGDVVVALMCQPSKKLLKQSGQVFSIADLAHKFSIPLARNQYSTNTYSFKMLLQILGWFKLSMLIPPFIKIPYWFMAFNASKY